MNPAGLEAAQLKSGSPVCNDAHAELRTDRVERQAAGYLASPLAHFVNGTQIEIDGGQSKVLMDQARDDR